MADLGSVLKAAVAQKASDIFLVVDQPPLVRFNGGMAVLQGFPPMNGQDTGRLILSSLFEEQRRILSENLELDCTFTAPGLGRFRMNVTTQQKGLHAVLRLIPPTIPTPEELEFPEALSALADLPRGLVLVTGPAGYSGTASSCSTITGLTPGLYTVGAPTVTSGSSTWAPRHRRNRSPSRHRSRPRKPR